MDSVKSFILGRFGRLDGLGGSLGTLLQYISLPNPSNPSFGSRLLCLLNIIPDTLSIPGALKLRPNWGLPNTNRINENPSLRHQPLHSVIVTFFTVSESFIQPHLLMHLSAKSRLYPFLFTSPSFGLTTIHEGVGQIGTQKHPRAFLSY